MKLHIHNNMPIKDAYLDSEEKPDWIFTRDGEVLSQTISLSNEDSMVTTLDWLWWACPDFALHKLRVYVEDCISLSIDTRED